MSIPDKLVSGIDRLEPLPMTVQKLVLMLDDEETDFNEVSRIIEYDGAITSNILRIANSAAYGGRVRIRHTRDAVVRLGATTLLDIMLIGHIRSMRVAAPFYSLSEDDFWLHSAAASLAVKAIIKETGSRNIPQASTVAALIHDIGKLIMVRYMEADATSLSELSIESNISLVEAERELFGCDHAEVGGAMAEKWSFPEPIKQAIEEHHQNQVQDPNLMLEAVMMANRVAKAVRCSESESVGADLLEDIAGIDGSLKFDQEGMDRICAHTATWLEGLKSSYGIQS